MEVVHRRPGAVRIEHRAVRILVLVSALYPGSEDPARSSPDRSTSTSLDESQPTGNSIISIPLLTKVSLPDPLLSTNKPLPLFPLRKETLVPSWLRLDAPPIVCWGRSRRSMGNPDEKDPCRSPIHTTSLLRTRGRPAMTVPLIRPTERP